MAYGGYQRDNPRLRQNPNTGEVEYVEGDEIEVSPNSAHQPWYRNPYALSAVGIAALPAIAAALPAAGAASGGSAASAAGLPPISTGIGGASFLSGVTAPSAVTAAAAPVAGATAAGTTAAAGTAAAAAGKFGLPELLRYGGRAVREYAAGRADDRAAEYDYMRDRDRAEMDRALLADRQLHTDLAQREWIENEYGLNARRALIGGLLEGIEDIDIRSPSQVPRANISGGLRPSAFRGREEIGSLMRSRGTDFLANPRVMAGEEGTAWNPRTAGMSDRDRMIAAVGYGPFNIDDVLAQHRQGIDPTQPRGVAVVQLADKLRSAGYNVEQQGDRIRFILPDGSYHPWGYVDALKNKGYEEGRHGPESQAWAVQPGHSKEDQRRLAALGYGEAAPARVMPGAYALPPLSIANPPRRSGLDSILDIGGMVLPGLALGQEYLSSRRSSRPAPLPPISTRSAFSNLSFM